MKLQKNQIGFIGIDQWGQHYHLKKHPRKELLEALGLATASKMYCDGESGEAIHQGYVIGEHWVSVYRIFPA